MIRSTIKILLLAILTFSAGCSKVLDIEPTDRLTASVIFGNPEGVKVYMANLYYQLPIEDFTFFRQGFRWNSSTGSGDVNNGGFAPAMATDEAVHSEFGDFLGNDDFHWWDGGFKLIRDVNMLIDAIPALQLTDADRAALIGESSFIKAYAYYALAKRYGGVPLMKQSQQYDGTVESIKEPRSTEQETWDYVMQLFDEAANNLTETSTDTRRANKWIALALKSRAALHAASVAKFGNRAPLSGEAVSSKLVGLDASLANAYYNQSIAAAEAVMQSGRYGLFRANPANADEAAENYRMIFQNPNGASPEALFIKGYAIPGNGNGQNYEIWYQPAQLANGWPHPGRMNPSLDLVDVYESYDNPGVSAPVSTTTDGDVNDYNGYSASKNYIRYNTPNDIFLNKDARLWGTAVLPQTMWKNTKIIIQAGFIKPDGSAVIRTNDQVTISGTTYYTFGAASTSQYSGFDTYGGNNTRTGFSFKKFLDESKAVAPGWNQGTTDFIDIRYAEVLLNYAEAVVESGTGNATLAAQVLNNIRERAGHTVDIPLTVENVQRERRVELAFENKRFWDLIRRREFHTEFNNRYMHSMLPLRDLRALPDEKYIFVRVNVPNTNTRTFEPRAYYRYIPGIGSNGLVQNPQY